MSTLIAQRDFINQRGHFHAFKEDHRERREEQARYRADHEANQRETLRKLQEQKRELVKRQREAQEAHSTDKKLRARSFLFAAIADGMDYVDEFIDLMDRSEITMKDLFMMIDEVGQSLIHLCALVDAANIFGYLAVKFPGMLTH